MNQRGFRSPDGKPAVYCSTSRSSGRAPVNGRPWPSAQKRNTAAATTRRARSARWRGIVYGRGRAPMGLAGTPATIV